MILKLAWRSLLAHPIRSLVLACGFGLGVSVMATLLGVGAVILDQARSPALVGGGDLVMTSTTGRLPSAKWILSSALGDGIAVASPRSRATLFLVRDGQTIPVHAYGGIPSLERALDDPETASMASWIDAPSDSTWSAPDQSDALRSLDRFHEIPDATGRTDSWAEWLYFNGGAGENRFYLTFMVGPRRHNGRRTAGVRLQLDRAGQRSNYSDQQEIDEAALLARAPDVTIGASRVRLEGMQYHLAIDLPAEPAAGDRQSGGASRAIGALVIEATPGRTLPPLTIHGANGWLSGYVVPVMSGALSGTLRLAGERVPFDGGTGYHDHNWGFWEDVSWQWGQVQHDGLSFIYGRVRPPADAADPDRVPGFLAALGPDGPIGYATNVSIDETNEAGTGRPRRIVIRGRSAALNITMDLAIEDAVVTRTRRGFLGGGMDFLQLRARYRVQGQANNRTLDFTAEGAAETFRTERR
jgi:hypothetical protein